MKKSSPNYVLALSLLSVAVAGCSGTKETLGLGRKVPDAFKVVSNPPLSVPPDFTLRPPSETFNTSSTIPQKARNALLKTLNQPEDASLSVAEQRFLMQADAMTGNPEIKVLLDQEYRQQTAQEQKEGVLDKVFSFTQGEEKATDPVINPAKEKQRLQKAKDGVETVDEVEEIKEEKEQKRGLLNRLFGF